MPRYFHQHSASAYHQKADQDRTTHAYIIRQEIIVLKSMVKPSLINVGIMKAKLSLWGISTDILTAFVGIWPTNEEDQEI